MLRDALIDKSGEYRYSLYRRWSGEPVGLFIMLNPSTADGLQDDPTIRKCIGFAQRWGLGGIYVANLFAYRSTSPTMLRIAKDPVGPDNDNHIRMMVDVCSAQSGPVICAWGAHGNYLDRAQAVLSLIAARNVSPMVLRLTEKSRMPEHPLYVPYNVAPEPLDNPAFANIHEQG